jgi:thioredoxin reductase
VPWLILDPSDSLSDPSRRRHCSRVRTVCGALGAVPTACLTIDGDWIARQVAEHVSEHISCDLPTNLVRVRDVHCNRERRCRRKLGLLAFDEVYTAVGFEARNSLAKRLGVDLTSGGRVQTDDRQRTSVPSVWAAGDIVTGLNQIAVAMAQAEIAAVDIHNALRKREALML